MIPTIHQSKLSDNELLRIAYITDPTPKGDVNGLMKVLRSVANEAAFQAYYDSQQTTLDFENSHIMDYLILALCGLSILSLIALVVILN